MADFSTIAHPYAKAVFELARDAGDYQAWSDSLQELAKLLADPQVAALAANPALSRADLAAGLASGLDGKVPADAVALVRILVDNGRLRAVAAIASEYEALRAEAERRVEVEITSAVPVAAEQQEKLAAAVKQRVARDVVISWKTDESLIGGAVIRAGDTIIDGSVSGELERLKTAVAR
ncbi:F0F1 ATP synthase subunit delta [Solimonas marina]|uniref:ATP synthase subunit delta n=1 Tax=Solimonas marina TaxID=2714601 RepID=A0A970B4M1_9GAMM|nr:F0F1 ATP synthase subunit delta [Solimonas marina]NKF20768.1 F0F1 ATP synthase subunit delta [Solimonas marina]